MHSSFHQLFPDAKCEQGARSGERSKEEVLLEEIDPREVWVERELPFEDLE
jgi:hypothetical protein